MSNSFPELCSLLIIFFISVTVTTFIFKIKNYREFLKEFDWARMTTYQISHY
jgi:hypothetical protein